MDSSFLLPQIMYPRNTHDTQFQGVAEPGQPDIRRGKGCLTLFSSRSQFRTSAPARRLPAPQVRLNLGFSQKVSFCSEGLERRSGRARDTGLVRQLAEEGCKEARGERNPGRRSSLPSLPRPLPQYFKAGLGRAGRPGPGQDVPALSLIPKPDGLACQESSVRGAHQKALTSLN
jgi:hypothetical protein